MQSEGVSVEAAALDESRCTVLEAVIQEEINILQQKNYGWTMKH